MNNKQLNMTLREQGRFLGMCDKFYNGKWDCSYKQLVEKLFLGIDFCLKHHWPSNEFITNNFPLDFRRQNGVFVDDEYSTHNIKNSLVLGDSDIRYRYSGACYGNINVRDNSSIHVTARGDTLVIVHLFEMSHAKVERSEKARVTVIIHSKNATVDAGPGVSVVEEMEYLK